jgi:hypothetical protein
VVSGDGPGAADSSASGDGAADDSAAWSAAGFSGEQAADFRRWRFTLAQAVEWRQAGVPDGLPAAQWLTAGATAATVGSWRAAGIDASQAVHWHEMGFDLQAARDAVGRGLTPETAFAHRNQAQFGAGGSLRGRAGRGDAFRRLHEAGVPPQVIQSYLSGSWDPEEVLPWARAGVDAADAALWRTLGITPAEAGRLARKGVSAAEAVRDWWRAGIPFDEVADWIGAGLSAAEAAEQRRGGITAEQAAALRALRDQDADD